MNATEEIAYKEELKALARRYNVDHVVIYLCGDRFKTTGEVRASSLGPVIGPAIGPALAGAFGKVFNK